MKLTLLLMLVCVSVMACETFRVADRAVRAVEEQVYAAGQAVGDNPSASSNVFEDDFVGRFASAYGGADQGIVVAQSRINKRGAAIIGK